MHQAKEEYHYKILLLGDEKVGKSSLLQKFVGDPELGFYYDSMGVDQKITHIDSADYSIKLRIWDASGSAKVWPLAQGYIPHANGIIIFFDMSNPSSFENIQKYLDCCKNKSIPIFLVGCKADMEKRFISYEHIQQKAGQLGLTYIETSSVKQINVREPFLQMAQRIHLLAEFNRIKPILNQHFKEYLKWAAQVNLQGLFATISPKEQPLREEYQANFGSISSTPNAEELRDFFKKTMDIIHCADLLFKQENRFLKILTTSPLSRTLKKILFELTQMPKELVDFSDLAELQSAQLLTELAAV